MANDVYYLKSIGRNLEELRDIVTRRLEMDKDWTGPTLGTEVLNDNIEWLEYYIENLERQNILCQSS